jgi:phosphohistidine phosphatase
MDLILWRHAEAYEAADGEDDMERALTQRGERQAQRIARWLDRQLPEGARIFCSPARRAEQTVIPLGRKYKVRDELSPQGSHEHLLELVQWPASKNPVVVVAHQPFLGHTVATLLNLDTENFPVRKGALWWLRSRQKEGLTQTVLITVQTPEML